MSKNKETIKEKKTALQSSAAWPETGFVRQKPLLDEVPFSPATLWRKVKAGTFPAPVKLSERVTAWRWEDVRAWA